MYWDLLRLETCLALQDVSVYTADIMGSLQRQFDCVGKQIDAENSDAPQTRMQRRGLSAVAVDAHRAPVVLQQGHAHHSSAHQLLVQQ